MRRGAFPFLAVALAASAQAAFAPAALAGPHDALIAKHAAANGVPEQLVRRVIRIESRGNAAAVHRGNYGLMQIRLGTARGVGYSGDAKGLLDPDTNLTYAVKYLAGAYRAAGCDADRAVTYYQRGYYGAAQRECGASQLCRREARLCAAKRPAELRRRGRVIKPKVVRTETIATPKSGVPPARPVGNFEPARVAPPPVQPVAASNPLPAKQAATPKTDTPQLIVAEPAAKVALAFVPLLRSGRSRLSGPLARSAAAGPARVRSRAEADVQPIHRTERAQQACGQEIASCRASQDGVAIRQQSRNPTPTIRPASFRS